VIDGPRLYQFADPADRDLALYHLSNRGKAWVLPLVAQIADQLAEPVALRCALMAAAVGKTGSGKVALRRFLTAFLAESDAAHRSVPVAGDPPPDVWGGHPWTIAMMADVDERFRRVHAVRVKFGAILNGEAPPVPEPAPKPAVIIPFPTPKEPPGPRWRTRAPGVESIPFGPASQPPATAERTD
jgi:hypothetical protein